MRSLGFISILLGQKGVDVGEDTSLSNGGVGQQLVELLVVPDGEEDVPGVDPGLLIVLSSVTGQLKNLSSEVLEDGSQIDWSASTDSLGILGVSQQSSEPTDWELQTGSARLRGSLSGGGLCLAALSALS
jgi:hypothetical protein